MFPDETYEAKPFFKRDKVDVQHVRNRLGGSPNWTALRTFVAFLDRLPPDSFEVFYERERNSGGSLEGYRVVHFTDRPTEKWHDTFSTWFGLSASMS